MIRYALCLVVAYLLGWVSHMSYIEHVPAEVIQPQYQQYAVPEYQYPPLPEGAVNDLRRRQ